MKIKEELEEAIMDTIKEHEEIIFGSDTPACMACLDELRKHQIIDQHAYDKRLMDDTLRTIAWEGLQKNIVRYDENTMIYKTTGEVLDEVDSTYWKEKF